MSLTCEGSEVLGEDFNSRNGTYLKVGDAIEVMHEDEFRVGRQTFRLDLEVDAPIKRGSSPTLPMPVPRLSGAAPAREAGGPAAQVTFAGQNVTLPVEPSQTILEVADEYDVELDFECWVGKCGCDLIRVVEGREFLNEVSDQESKTIKRRGVTAGEYRLACMTRVSGPVVVEAVD